MEPSEIIERVNDAWVTDLRQDPSFKPREQDPIWRPPYVYASARRSCVRQIALDLLHPEELEGFDPDGMERMVRGRETEQALVARLMRIGKLCNPPFEVQGSQVRFEIRDSREGKAGPVIIVGKVDGRLSFPSLKLNPVFEIKWGLSVQNVRSLEDMDAGKWTKHMPDQLLSYLYATGEPWGFFVLCRPGLPRLLPVALSEHLGRVESFLQDARAAVDARHGLGPLPGYTEDYSLCRSCPHNGKSCAPPQQFGSGYQVIVNEEYEAAAKVYTETKEAAKRNAKAWEVLKEGLRGVEQGLLGDYEVTGKWGKAVRFDVPQKIKDKYRSEDPKGRFTLKVRRVTGDAAVYQG